MLNEAEIRNEQYVQFRPRYTSFGFFQFHHTLTSLFYPFRKKKCIHVTLHLFLPSFFFSLHPLCTFARKSINEIGSIKKRRVILLDTVTCNSFFFFLFLLIPYWNDSREFLSKCDQIDPHCVTRWKVASNERYSVDTKFWNK